jgi:hypothetical protein
MQSTPEMQSTPDIKQADPTTVDPGPSTQKSGLSAPDKELVARADERLAHAYQQIALADEQLARMNQQMSRLAPEAEHQPAPRPSRGGSALRGLVGLLLAACIFGAAFASQFASDATRQIISRWSPQAASVVPDEKAQPSVQPDDTPSVQLAAADATLPQAPPAAQTTPHEVAPPAAIPAELTQMLESMSHDLANVLQKIDELKASQDQLARDQANTAEQVKANQEQVARLVATAEQNQRAATPAPLPRPATATARTPTPPPTAQARVQRQSPVQLRPQLQ